MNYQEAIDWMFQQLPMYQRIGSTAFKKDLSNTHKLAQHLQEPQKRFRTIHVAGTNGKGSVSHMLASILQENGFKVGLYTSPHLKDFRERIKLNGREIPKEAVVNFVESNKAFLEREQLSFFEMTVGMAFNFFAESGVQVAVIEVGMGGRLDSTNIITPELSVITNISLDHTHVLGNSLEEIAVEKGGIIKKNTPVVIGEYQPDTFPVFQRMAREQGAELSLAKNIEGSLPETDLRGAYQEKNVCTALMAVSVLNRCKWGISDTAITDGLRHVIRNTGLRGRWEILQKDPKVICDTAHNPEGLVLAMQQLLEEDFDSLFLVIGVVSDKDLETILPLFPEIGHYFFCRPDIPRGLDATILQEKAKRAGLNGDAYPSVSEAYRSALKAASPSDVIYVGGSTFTVAEII